MPARRSFSQVFVLKVFPYTSHGRHTMRSSASGNDHVTVFRLGERDMGRAECDLSDIGSDLDTTNQRVYG